MSTGTRFSDRVRREWYLARFAWHMQDFPQRQYRQIKRDLRRELTTAAADVGMPQAVAGLGTPRHLAEQYTAELGRPVPRLATGAVAAAVTIGLILYLGLAYALGTQDTLEALGGGSVTTYPFGAETTFTNTAQEISLETNPSLAGTAFVLGAAFVAFTLGSRLWRFGTGRRSPGPTDGA